MLATITFLFWGFAILCLLRLILECLGVIVAIIWVPISLVFHRNSKKPENPEVEAAIDQKLRYRKRTRIFDRYLGIRH